MPPVGIINHDNDINNIVDNALVIDDDDNYDGIVDHGNGSANDNLDHDEKYDDHHQHHHLLHKDDDEHKPNDNEHLDHGHHYDDDTLRADRPGAGDRGEVRADEHRGAEPLQLQRRDEQGRHVHQ